MCHYLVHFAGVNLPTLSVTPPKSLAQIQRSQLNDSVACTGMLHLLHLFSLDLTMQVVHLVAMNYSHNAARAASATLQGMSNGAPVMSRGKRAGVGQAIAAQWHHTGTHGQSNASMARYVLSKHDPEVG